MTYTDRYFGTCETDFDTRDSVFYTARCMDNSETLRKTMKKVNRAPKSGKLLLVSLSYEDFKSISRAFDGNIVQKSYR